MAEEIAPGRFRLGHLLRAAGGSDDAMASGAAAGASFVLLERSAGRARPPFVRSRSTARWRLVPADGRSTIPLVARHPATALGGRALTPLSPVHLSARFAPDGAVSITFVRRTRVDGDRWDGLHDVPLGEEIERYVVRLSADGFEAERETPVPA